MSILSACIQQWVILICLWWGMICTVIIHICCEVVLHMLALMPNFDFYLCSRVKFHESSFWVPILAAGGPYWVPIWSLFHKKNGSLLGPYLKAWGSLLVWESVSLGFAENICNLASAAPVPWWSESRLERECNIFQSAQVTVRNFVEYITQARLLLDRVQVLCRGVAEVGRRRRWQEGEERRMGKEQRAHHLSLLLGRAVYRRGDLELAWVKKWFDVWFSSLLSI